MNKAIFLDRDGTINKEINYLYRPEDFMFINGTVEAIRIFHELGYIVIVITNQAGVAKGYYTENDIMILHNYIDKLLANSDTYIDKYYYCPHHIDGIINTYKIKCDCRKPSTGMIDKAVADYNINLKNSIIIGDKEIDIEVGKKAGISKCVLVRSGHNINESETKADCIYDNIYDFAQSIYDNTEL